MNQVHGADAVDTNAGTAADAKTVLALEFAKPAQDIHSKMAKQEPDSVGIPTGESELPMSAAEFFHKFSSAKELYDQMTPTQRMMGMTVHLLFDSEFFLLSKDILDDHEYQRTDINNGLSKDFGRDLEGGRKEFRCGDGLPDGIEIYMGSPLEINTRLDEDENRSLPLFRKGDGHQRIGQFKIVISKGKRVIAPVNFRVFRNEKEACAYYKRANKKQLSKSTADSLLKNEQVNIPDLVKIGKACPFITYDKVQVARGKMIRMSVALGCYFDARTAYLNYLETGGKFPTGYRTFEDTKKKLQEMPNAKWSADQFIGFMNLFHGAFHPADQPGSNDANRAQLWNETNLTLCLFASFAAITMGNKKMTGLHIKTCLTYLVANESYLSFVGARGKLSNKTWCKEVFTVITTTFKKAMLEAYGIKRLNLPRL